MTASELKRKVGRSGNERYFFTRDTMKFFGDTMRNYGVRGPFIIVNNLGKKVSVMELYRKKAVKYGLSNSAYFNVEDWSREFPERRA
jgi:hypothetical protein